MLKIRAIVVYKNKQAKSYNVKIRENQSYFNLREAKLTFNINETDGYLMGKKPKMHYFYNEGNPNPINLFNGEPSKYTSAQYNKLMTTHLLDKFLALTKPTIDFSMFFILGLIAVVLVGGYYLFKMNGDLQAEIEIIKNLLMNQGGF